MSVCVVLILSGSCCSSLYEFSNFSRTFSQLPEVLKTRFWCWDVNGWFPRSWRGTYLVLLDCRSPWYFPAAYSFQAASQNQLPVSWMETVVFFPSCYLRSAIFGEHVDNHEKRTSKNRTLKVAEHSFSARSCWCNLARAQGFQKTNMPSTERSFYLLKTRTICVIFLYNCVQCIDGLQRYVTKGNIAKNPAIFSAFVCYRKNPVKCNACAVARKIETDCFSRNVQFSSDPVVRISRDLAQK